MGRLEVSKGVTAVKAAGCPTQVRRGLKGKSYRIRRVDPGLGRTGQW